MPLPLPTKSTIFGKMDAQWKPVEGIDLGRSTQHMERCEFG
eukprot:COSAG01_NODE_3187_length_6441_cov_16.292179_1_plen_41_part_00